jgi:uncharacterized protein
VAATEFDSELRSTRRAVEVRAAGGSRTIGGYAATFNSRSEPLNGFVETVSKSFFNKSKGDGWPGVVCRYNHNDLYVLGATRSGTLRLSVDGTGLDYAVDVPECRGDVLELVQRGDISHSSFSFVTYEQGWGFEDGYPLRTLISGRLVDTAPVPVPAYTNTSVAMRSLAEHMQAPLEDVVTLAKSDDLRKLFIRTDRPLSGPVALAQITRKRYPAADTLNGRVALARVRARRWPEYS